MSVEERRRLKKRAKSVKPKKEKKTKVRHGANPKKELSEDEIKAQKKAQRLSMFDKKKNTYKK